MKINTIRPVLSHSAVHRCPQCDLVFNLSPLNAHETAYCPRCMAKIVSGNAWPLSRLVILAIAMMILMPCAFSWPLISIRLLGMNINASVLGGIYQMVSAGNVLTAAMVTFGAIGAPVTLVLAIFYLLIGHWLGMNLRPVLLMLEKLKEWVMLDIYLVGIAVAAIKVQDYAALTAGYGLTAFITLTVLSLLTLINLNPQSLWQTFYPQKAVAAAPEKIIVCLHCHFSGLPDDRGRCPRCHTPLDKRRPHSLQKTWAALIASIILLFPANLLPISVIYLNGSQQADTIFSGILSLGAGNFPVAMVVFIASILVPFSKVLIMISLLLSIHFHCVQGLKTRIRLLRAIKWIGRWSMLDLFVISLTMSLVNRDQLLAFTMGPAAFYFGSAVILTILAAEWLDSRLLWDAHATGNAEYAD
ncbi:membrane integrity lipid transport subunit YebS [Tatumella sp. UCD-D_suzukii]|uniref:membrane integrity lipid transport subunit YebS n=1 Tax=Tatumella sp. UCD-D_suzukii TaxID=1408192 RepID=UPI0004726B20|nr:membrane integrity lipid transport subunit YebS [Tatumella sp. UCD-D_suzukii]